MQSIERLPFFRGFSAEILAPLQAAASWRSFEAGQVVVEDGDPTQEVFFLAEGAVRVLGRTSGGHELILNELKAGDMVGEYAAIDGAPRSAAVVALTRTRLCALPSAPFMAFVLATPAAALQLLRLLTARVRERDARLIELVALPVRLRLASLLLRLSRPRVGGDGRVISPPPPHHELAARIGTRREVVSRILSQMQREGLLTTDRRAIALPQPEMLAAAVEAGFQQASGGG
ncbi:Crp/Fnr family transcriptional regulator [Siccirubricoccus sp. KC 17139]|uniref:Crp/Fnr family transcriptional regulator n=1 Tax=Siccirubricoccus soli TaxID=2899147 RepID=A0ABT1D9J3_9PROT|nr:Crp/Fnr family transcriptional regulator [Siccirubricoccus soli]MCO6417869.1 Crp/Fnr family transcriptional regulator [Siccirubricoccus soli]MCP2684004.1 Crp/Fnr family transcriptional regulator [Siccirubricoccus soli]